MSLNTGAEKAGESGWRETIRIIVHALILAMIVRVFFYQPFNIPSGSMKSTLMVGDYLFVSKLSYGYSRYSFPWGIVPFSGRIFGAEPKRGDEERRSPPKRVPERVEEESEEASKRGPLGAKKAKPEGGEAKPKKTAKPSGKADSKSRGGAKKGSTPRKAGSS